jgi:hypothetical protein
MTKEISSLLLTQKAPFTLVVSSIGYETKEVEFSGTALSIEMNVSYALGQEIVVARYTITTKNFGGARNC